MLTDKILTKYKPDQICTIKFLNNLSKVPHLINKKYRVNSTIYTRYFT